MQKKGIITLAFTAIVLSSFWAYQSYKTLVFESSPTYALVSLEEALQEKNFVHFEKFVHMQKVSESLLSQILQPEESVSSKEETQKPEQENSFLNALSSVGQKFKERFAEYVQPELSNSLSEQIKDFVVTGKFLTGIPKEDAHALLMLSHVWRKIYGEGLVYKGFSDVFTEGETSSAIITLYRPDIDYNIPVDVSLKQIAGSWQVVSIRHLGHILERIRFLEHKILEEKNKAIKAKMEKNVQILHFEKSAGLSEWGVGKGVLLSVSFENIGQKTVSEIEAQIRFVDKDSHVLRQVTLKDTDLLAPKEISEKSWPMAINPLSASDMQIYEDKEINMQVSLQRLVFEDGQSLAFEKK